MAKDYFQSEEFNDLLKTYESQLESNQSIYLDADDFADIADFYLTEDKPDEALKAIGLGLSIHPDEEVLLIIKSATFIYMQQYEKAQEILYDLDLENNDVRYQVAQLEYALYDHKESAEDIWRTWMEYECHQNSTPSTVEETKRDCYLHIISSMIELHNPVFDEGKEWDKAEVRRWVEEYIDVFQPLGKYDEDVQLVDICRDGDLLDLMIEVLSQVLEERPYLRNGWASLALAQFLSKQYDQAIESSDFALAVNPDCLEALLTKAHALHKMKEDKLALPLFKEYLERGGDVVQAIPYAESLFKAGDVTMALDELEMLFSHLEKRYKEYSNLLDEGKLDNEDSSNNDDKKKTKQSYESFINNYMKAFIDLADVYHSQGYYNESIKANEKVLEVDKEYAEAYFMQGINYLALEQYETSATYFAKALQYAVDQVMMGLDIALTFVLNDFDSFALEVLNAISQIADKSESPCVKNIAVAKSLVYLKMGNTSMFLQHFKKACHITPELVKKVYEECFPMDLPVKKWGRYAEENTDQLIEQIKNRYSSKKGFY